MAPDLSPSAQDGSRSAGDANLPRCCFRCIAHTGSCGDTIDPDRWSPAAPGTAARRPAADRIVEALGGRLDQRALFLLGIVAQVARVARAAAALQRGRVDIQPQLDRALGQLFE